MKKSDIYFQAQKAVLFTAMPTDSKLEVLRELMAREDIEKCWENARDMEKANEAI